MHLSKRLDRVSRTCLEHFFIAVYSPTQKHGFNVLLIVANLFLIHSLPAEAFGALSTDSMSNDAMRRAVCGCYCNQEPYILHFPSLTY